jgi:hypothetical protein
MKVCGGLAFVYIISLITFESSIVLSLITLLFMYKIHLFSIETIIRNASKIKRKSIPPLWFQISIQNNQSMKKTQVCL